MTRVLHVSYEWVLADACNEVLEYTFQEVVWVHSVPEGVFYATTSRFNLVVMEFRLSQGSSLELAEALTIYDPSLPLILYSASIPPDRQNAIARIPFKTIIHLPASYKQMTEAFRLYAREDAL